MLASVWAWLTNEANQKALALLGGFFAFLWTAGWAVFVYVRPPPDRKHESPRRTGGPARERSYNQTKRPLARAISSHVAFKIWLLGIFVVAIGSAVWKTSVELTPPSVTYTVCSGEFEQNCGAPHDVFLQCGGPSINAWVDGTCDKILSSTRIVYKDGNKCGYSVMKYTCVPKKPK
jgi:hypothetical protein